MDKNAIKKYAVWARRELIQRVSQRAMLYGVTERDAGAPDAESVNGRPLSADEKRQRRALIRKVEDKGYEQTMEQAAYTWFNRFAALRFMEVNGYLPSHVRVFTNDKGEFKPQILDEAIHLELDGLDRNKVYELEDANRREGLYKYLLITQCNALSGVLPGLFGRIDDYAALLLPDNLLREGSVIERMVSAIPEEDWKDQVQIIGWLYQYYNTEPKEQVFADLKRNVKIMKDRIPAATQLFTPDWIVHYMVENSLGRLWLEGHPNDALKAEWKYYLDEAEQTPEVRAQLDAIRKERAALTPEEIRVIDPCMGSGHILCVLFDVLVRIYESYGYAAREAAAKIVERNLWGLDIDERAAQLAYFAVMMKARRYDRRFFKRGIQPHVYAPADYPDGEEFGALITVDALEPEPSEQLELGNSLNRWNFRHALAQKYHVVVTNPPYMGASGMNDKLSKFVKENYPDSKSDLSTVSMERALKMCNSMGYMAMINIPVWMFLSSYEKLRLSILRNNTYINMVHPGRGIFGSDFGTTSFVIAKRHIDGYKGQYRRLFDVQGEVKSIEERERAFLSGKGTYISCQDDFSKIPGAPVAYWWKNYDMFSHEKVKTYYESAGRNKTHNNELYVLCWWEIADYDRWQPYANGGIFRRWRGNDIDFVDWSKTAKSYYALHGGLYNQKYAGKRGVCWNLITSYKNGFRMKRSSHHYSSAAPTVISTGKDHDDYLLAFLNSCVAEAILKIYNPTLNTTVGDVLELPFIIERETQICALSHKAQEVSQADWDAFETSWDFQKHPLIRPVSTIAEAFRQWENECAERFDRLKANEEQLNRIFIDIYGLQDELSPDVDDKDVTVRKADLQRDIRSFLSYAAGCMFGRYSLDGSGLAYAGGPWDPSQYSAFPPVPDDIIPICDDEYFDDDMTARFVKFVETVYGTETLEDNLRFIADALGGKGASREVIRNYFLNGFYADHLKIYQKRPIYWLFDSGKRNAFKCLIYLHRYRPDTIARIRTDYVHEQQARYRTELSDLEKRVEKASTSERVKLSKRLTALRERAEELRLYEEKIHHLADRMIAIDLDDGVKRNYELFKDVLAKIK